ncbi:MAG: exodeoxyribonuclease I [Spirochaetales bacterium]|nr:exodeoxyribonuclease I [Spirochaetales bacterium]
MQNETIFWYDLETFGLNSQHDRIAQFAGVRTDTNLRIIGEPLILYCRITNDYLPDPLACLVTGITPQVTLEKGMPENEFIQRINEEFSKTGTCVTGFNNIKFDDEFIRNALYRNFYDPYLREYAQGNTRWDIIDMVRAAHDLRPDGINWPRNEEGRPSFRLEALTAANDVAHTDAHDALADVYATLEIARLIRDKQPGLYAYAFAHRKKSALKEKINLYQHKPILHTSAVYTSEYGCTALILPLAVNPNNSNSIICFNLANDPEILIAANSEELLGSEIHLTMLSLNKSPFIAPTGTLTDDAAERLHIDKNLCMEHFARIEERHDIPMKLRSAFEKQKLEGISDPDFRIYTGGFFSDEDRERFRIIHNTPTKELLSLHLNFNDSRIPEMLWRYTARNYPEILNEEEQKKWKSFAASRILFPPADIMVNLQFFKRKIVEKSDRTDISPKDKIILRDLADYAEILEKHLFH